MTFTIALPAPAIASKQRRLRYVSQGTNSATVTVTPSGFGPATTVIPCNTSAGSCSGTVSAPVGSDTFVASLWSGLNGSGSMLATGTAATRVVGGAANTVRVTFNPVVASATLSLDAANATAPYLDHGTRTSVTVDLVTKDASGATIIGPGSYADTTGAPLTLTVSSNDPNLTLSSAGQPSGPPSFSAPASGGGPNVLVGTLGSGHAAFEDPFLSVHASVGTAPAVTNLDIPVSPVVASGSTFMGNEMTSMAVDSGGLVYATLFDFGVSADVVVRGASGDEPPVDHAAKSLAFLTLAGTTPWFFVDNAPAASKIAELSPADGCAQGVCPGSAVPAEISALVLGQDGQLWFAESSSLIVGSVNPANPPATAPTVSLPPHAGATVQLLVPGASGGTCSNATAVFAIVQSSSATYIESIASNGTVSEAANPVTSISGGVNIAGYSPANCSLFVVAGDGTLWRLIPSTGTAYVVGTGAPLSSDQNGRAMVVLPDNTLAYVGTIGGKAYPVHVVNGRIGDTAAFTTVVPEDSTGAATSLDPPGPWAIGADGTIYTWDGGNRHAAVW